MNAIDEALYAAINEAERLRERTKKKHTKQVQGTERDIIRATALAWVNNHRKSLLIVLTAADLAKVDSLYQQVIAASHRAALRSKYVSLLKQVTKALVTLRTDNVIRLSNPPAPVPATADLPPDFSTLITDVQMQEILKGRWVECTACIAANAPLASIVMMGGLLEGLLLARINSAPDKAAKDRIFKATAAPKDKHNQTLQLKEWTLQNYIAVAHELGWISQTVMDIGTVLRDYRNYIHPQKELSEKIKLKPGDASFLWEISKNIARQLLR
jgi:hypothetical protein